MPYYRIKSPTQELLNSPIEHTMNYLHRYGYKEYCIMYDYIGSVESENLISGICDYLSYRIISPVFFQEIVQSKYIEDYFFLRQLTLFEEVDDLDFFTNAYIVSFNFDSEIDLIRIRELLIAIKCYLQNADYFLNRFSKVALCLRKISLAFYKKVSQEYSNKEREDEIGIKIFMEYLMFLSVQTMNIDNTYITIEESYFWYTEYFLPYVNNVRFAIETKKISLKTFRKQLKEFEKSSGQSILRVKDNRALYSIDFVESFINYKVITEDYILIKRKVKNRIQDSISKYSYYFQYLNESNESNIHQKVENFIENLYGIQLEVQGYCVITKTLLLINNWNNSDEYYINKVINELQRVGVDLSDKKKAQKNILFFVNIIRTIITLDISPIGKKRKDNSFILNLAMKQAGFPEICDIISTVDFGRDNLKTIFDKFIKYYLINEKQLESKYDEMFREIRSDLKEVLQENKDIYNNFYTLLWKDFRRMFPVNEKRISNSISALAEQLVEEFDISKLNKYNSSLIVI